MPVLHPGWSLSLLVWIVFSVTGHPDTPDAFQHVPTCFEGPRDRKIGFRLSQATNNKNLAEPKQSGTNLASPIWNQSGIQANLEIRKEYVPIWN